MRPNANGPRSCDRCYSLKERCQWPTNSDRCERCARLRSLCQTKRPVKKAGRRPKALISGAATSAKPASKESWSERAVPPVLASPAIFGDTSPDDIQVANTILSQDSFIEQFIHGPSFCHTHRQMLISHFAESRALLQPGLLACVLLWPNSSDPSAWPDGRQLSRFYGLASSSLQALQSLSVSNAHDVSSCLVLGGLVLTFSLRLGSDQVQSVCSYVLSRIKPIYESKKCVSADLTFLPCLVLTETMGCLFRGTIPTLRMRLSESDEPILIDRWLGVCTAFMPHLYDLCQVIATMNQRGTSEMAQTIRDLEQKIRNWRPNIPDGFADNFTTTEVICILGQAQVFQSAALLIINRLYSPFGIQDAVAMAHSSSILVQFDYMRRITRQALRNLDFALAVACVEVPDAEERRKYVRNYSSLAVSSEPYAKRFDQLLESIWRVRTCHPSMCWYELVSAMRR